MKVKILLADIFDQTTPTAMEQRIEYAFGVDGQDFWEKFFPCSKTHPNDSIIYLFTEYQLWVLYNWLAEKYKVYGENINRNLNFSRQKLFRNGIRVLDGRYTDVIRACYIKYDANLPELQRLFFGLFPAIKRQNYTDFFDGRFRGDLPAVFTENERRRRLIEILGMRPAISKLFGGPAKNDKKWLCYLGPRVFNEDHPLIEYCNDINPCSLQEI